MNFNPLIYLSEFKLEVESHFRSDYDPTEYRSDVSKALIEVRDNIFGISKKEMDELWPQWMNDAKEGFDEKQDARELEQYFNVNAVKGLEKGRSPSALIHAIAAHYRLHRYLEPEKLELAKTIDEAVFKKSAKYIFGKPVFEYDPDVFRNVKLNAPISHPTYKTKDYVETELNNNKHHSIWLDPHNHHSIPLEGRMKEMTDLDEFVQRKGSFRICPVIGPSGAGKTRLISQWMRNYSPLIKDTGWEAGFIISDKPNSRSREQWKNWIIDRSTILVVDYTHAFDEVIREIANQVRIQDNEHKVRLILIDHIMPQILEKDFLWGEFDGGRKTALDSFRQNFLERPILLQGEKNSSTILKKIIASSASLDGTKYKENDAIIIQALQHLDEINDEYGSIRHPLFAALMGQAIRQSNEEKIDFTNWSRAALIDYYFESDDRLPWLGWGKELEKRNNGLLIGALITAATLRRGLNVNDAKVLLPRASEDIIQKANRIVGFDKNYKVKEFLPDILGEAFVLKFLIQVSDNIELQYQLSNLIECGDPEDLGNIAANFYETILRLMRNLENITPTDIRSLEDLELNWVNVCNFLKPSFFQANTPLRSLISICVVEALNKLQTYQSKLSMISYKKINVKRYQIVSEIEELSKTFDKLKEELIGQFSALDIASATIYHKPELLLTAFLQYLEFVPAEKAVRSSKYVLELSDRYLSDNTENWTALFLACELGCFKALRFLIEECKLEAKQKNETGLTPLMVASENGHLDIVEYLLTYTIDQINVENKDGKNALMFASEAGSLAVVKFLHKSGGNAYPMVKGLRNALIFASEQGHLDIVKYLYSEGLIEGTPTTNGWDPIKAASFNGYLDVVKYLHEVEPEDICIPMQNKRTPIMLASENGHVNVVKYLFQKGATLNAVTETGHTALTFAKMNGHVDVINFIESVDAK